MITKNLTVFRHFPTLEFFGFLVIITKKYHITINYLKSEFVSYINRHFLVIVTNHPKITY